LAVELHSRPAAPIPLFIPELDASYPTPVAWEVNGAGSAARGDSVSNLYLMVAAILEMHDYAIELDGAPLELVQNRPEGPACIYRDSVVIRPAVHVCLSQILPSSAPITISISLSVCRQGEIGDHQQHSQHQNRFA
jgi:hypothetical protein